MTQKPVDWHKRYTQQARWTEELRQYIINQVWNHTTRIILEVGCGSGAILSTLKTRNNIINIGIDLDFSIIQIARHQTSKSKLLQADGYDLPFASKSIDSCFCHYFLLWLSNPLFALNEMKRVTKSGGTIIAFAEPDYDGRIDYPQNFIELGKVQISRLIQQGVDPMIGRRLPELFNEAGLTNISSGIMGGKLATSSSVNDIRLEWAVLLSDLDGEINEDELSKLQIEDEIAWAKGTRVLFVPTFYAWGFVP